MTLTDHRHDHHHDHHDHDHPHAHPHREEPGIVDGPVVLDIGGGFGALVVTMPDEAEGTEIHARVPGEAPTTHTGVWRRTHGSGSSVTAVFPELRAGAWTLLDPQGGPRLEVVIEDGSVTFADLR